MTFGMIGESVDCKLCSNFVGWSVCSLTVLWEKIWQSHTLQGSLPVRHCKRSFVFFVRRTAKAAPANDGHISAFLCEYAATVKFIDHWSMIYCGGWNKRLETKVSLESPSTCTNFVRFPVMSRARDSQYCAGGPAVILTGGK